MNEWRDDPWSGSAQSLRRLNLDWAGQLPVVRMSCPTYSTRSLRKSHLYLSSHDPAHWTIPPTNQISSCKSSRGLGCHSSILDMYWWHDRFISTMVTHCRRASLHLEHSKSVHIKEQSIHIPSCFPFYMLSVHTNKPARSRMYRVQPPPRHRHIIPCRSLPDTTLVHTSNPPHQLLLR